MTGPPEHFSVNANVQDTVICLMDVACDPSWMKIYL